MSYRTQRPRPAPKSGRRGPDYTAAVTVVRERAAAGEPCYFWQRNPACPHPWIDLTLHHNHRHAFTAHHLQRLMDGGQPVPDPQLMAPAHRGCNSWDGLVAQNARRAGLPLATAADPQPEHRSRDW